MVPTSTSDVVSIIVVQAAFHFLEEALLLL
jgi:hypothetical protein